MCVCVCVCVCARARVEALEVEHANLHIIFAWFVRAIHSCYVYLYVSVCECFGQEINTGSIKFDFIDRPMKAK